MASQAGGRRTCLSCAAALAACLIGSTPGCGDDDGSANANQNNENSNANGNGNTALPPTRVYATLVTHNEEEPNVVCTPTVTNEADYLANRALTLELARSVIEHGAAWDLGTDWQYLQAVAQWDTSSVMTDTAGVNLIAYLATLSPQHLVVDAHAHETDYNYADVVHLLDGLGVPRNGVASGFFYLPVEREVWTRLASTLVGIQTPDATWTAEILWGAATDHHEGPDSLASGVWRPRDAASFHEDDPTQRLVNVGGVTGDATGLDLLLTRLNAGELEEGRLYTASLFLNQCGIRSEDLAQLNQLFDDHAADVTAGTLVWATLPEIVRVWREEYGSTPVILQADPCPSCESGSVCCEAPAPCAGTCVPDCRVVGNSCPAPRPTCNSQTGICES